MKREIEEISIDENPKRLRSAIVSMPAKEETDSITDRYQPPSDEVKPVDPEIQKVSFCLAKHLSELSYFVHECLEA